MPDVCSCGTQLVDGALFCHRCGKAQRALVAEDAVYEPEPAPVVKPVVAEAPVIAPPPVVSFQNGIAVRIGFLAASVASMLEVLPGLNLLFFFWSLAAGFGAVVLYSRSTGQPLKVGSGAKMGLITGVLNATILMVVFTLKFATDSSELSSSFRKQFDIMAVQDPARYAVVKPLLDSPYAMAAFIIVSLFFMLVIFTTACVAGGALGARFNRKNVPSA